MICMINYKLVATCFTSCNLAEPIWRACSSWNQVATFDGVANIRDGHGCQPLLYRASITVDMVMEKPKSKWIHRGSSWRNAGFSKHRGFQASKSASIRLRRSALQMWRVQRPPEEIFFYMCLLALGMLLGLAITPVTSSDHVFQVTSNHPVADFLWTPAGNPTWR